MQQGLSYEIKNPRPEKDEDKTRVTTFVCKQFALPASASVYQHSGADNVHHYVTAYWNVAFSERKTERVKSVRCKAQGCIRNKCSVRLSSAGSFLSGLAYSYFFPSKPLFSIN